MVDRQGSLVRHPLDVVDPLLEPSKRPCWSTTAQPLSVEMNLRQVGAAAKVPDPDLAVGAAGHDAALV